MPKIKDGSEIPLEGVVARLRHGLSYAFTGKADWMGPGAPVTPSAPPEVAGRQFQLPVSYNTLIQTKTEGIGFGQLRLLSNTCDILRILIEMRKDQVCGMSWTIQDRAQPTTSGKGAKHTSARDAGAITEFFQCPDGEKPWSMWLRMLLEDMLVLDAPTLYVQKTKAGLLHALRPIDGATIKRLIDPHGWIPDPPLPAYQQILQGTAALDYQRDEIVYLPKNMRTDRIYGYGRVEQIIVTARTWLARQASNIEYYDAGAVPDGLLSGAKDWGIKEIKTYEDLFNLQMSGQLGERRKVKIIPNDAKFTQTKQPALKDDYDEWLARIVCACFGVSPTPFIRQLNRSSAKSSKDDADETGLQSDLNWVKRLVDHILARLFGRADLEFAWEDRAAQDPLERAQIDAIYLAQGVVTANEVRADLGLLARTEPQESTPSRLTTEAPVDESQAPSAPVPQKNRAAVLHKALQDRDHKKLADAVRAALMVAGDDVSKVVGSGVGDLSLAALDPAVAGAMAAGLALAAPDLHEAIAAGALDGAKSGASDMGTIESAPALSDAATWAKQHAAELIREDANGGELAESTRNMLRTTLTDGIAEGLSRAKLAQALKNSYAFSPERAALIAQTEIRNAQGAGLLIAYRRGGMVQKRWLLSNDANICPLCIANAEQGWIAIDSAFASGAEHPLQHVRCRCDMAARKSEV